MNLLSPLKFSDSIVKLLEASFNEVEKECLKNASLRRQGLKKEQKKIRQKQELIEKAMIRTNNNGLYEKLEKDWAELDSEYEVLEESSSNKIIDTHRTKILFNKTKAIFTNPLDIWAI